MSQRIRGACGTRSPLTIPLLAIHTSIRRGRATTTHYTTHHQVSLMVSHNTTLAPSLELRIGPVCEAGLSAGMRRERVSPQNKKEEEERKTIQQKQPASMTVKTVCWPD